ncbi:hypothetical protein [Deinococcus sonorensis]
MIRSWLTRLSPLHSAFFSSQRRLTPAELEHLRRGSQRLTFRGPVNLPLVGGPLLPLVEVHLNGRGPYRFLLDAGANVVSVHQRIADELNLRVVKRLRTRRVCQVEILDLGPACFQSALVVSEMRLDVDGILGFNLFREGLLTLDYPRQRFRWGPGALPITDDATLLTYELRERMPYVPVQVDGRTVWCNLDTGARPGLIVPLGSRHAWPVVAAPDSGPTLWNQHEGHIPTQRAQLSVPLRIGPVEIHHPEVLFSPALEDECLLGSGLLQAFTLTFDLAAQRVRIQAEPAG